MRVRASRTAEPMSPYTLRGKNKVVQKTSMMSA